MPGKILKTQFLCLLITFLFTACSKDNNPVEQMKEMKNSTGEMNETTKELGGDTKEVKALSSEIKDLTAEVKSLQERMALYMRQGDARTLRKEAFELLIKAPDIATKFIAAGTYLAGHEYQLPMGIRDLDPILHESIDEFFLYVKGLTIDLDQGDLENTSLNTGTHDNNLLTLFALAAALHKVNDNQVHLEGTNHTMFTLLKSALKRGIDRDLGLIDDSELKKWERLVLANQEYAVYLFQLRMNYSLALAFDGASGTSKYSEAKGFLGFIKRLFKPLLKGSEEKIRQGSAYLSKWDSKLPERNPDTIKMYNEYLNLSSHTAEVLISLGEKPVFYGPMMKAFSNMKDPEEKSVDEDRVAEIKSFAAFGNVTLSSDQRAELMAYAHNSAVDEFMDMRDQMLELSERPWSCDDLKKKSDRRECRKSPSFNEYQYRNESSNAESAASESNSESSLENSGDLTDEELKDVLENDNWEPGKREYSAPEESDAPEEVKKDPEYQLSIIPKDDKEKRNFLKKLIKDLKDKKDDKKSEKEIANTFTTSAEFYEKYEVSECKDIKRFAIKRRCKKLEKAEKKASDA